MAANSLDQSSFTPQEKAALEIAIKKIDELNDTIDKRIELGRLYREQQFGENVDRATAAQTHTDTETLDNKIKRMDNDLLSVEKKEVLKGILKKSRQIIEAEDRRKSDERLTRWRDRRNNADAIRKYRTRLETDIAESSGWITHPDNKNAMGE